MKKFKTINIIAPCYNEELNIDEYLNRVLKTLETLKIDYEIFLIDDGSEDKTWKKILENCLHRPQAGGILTSDECDHDN